MVLGYDRVSTRLGVNEFLVNCFGDERYSNQKRHQNIFRFEIVALSQFLVTNFAEL